MFHYEYGDNGFLEPGEASLKFMDKQVPNWRIFEAVDPFFPPFLVPKVKYKHRQEVHYVYEGERVAFERLLKVFSNTAPAPFMIHSLKGKIHSTGTPEGFGMFEKVIKEAHVNGKCELMYFLTRTGGDAEKKKDKLRNENVENANITEIGDILLLYPNTICIIEIKDNKGGNDAHLNKAVENCIRQFHRDESWIKNSFGLFWRNEDFNQPPAIKKYAAFPLCDRKFLSGYENKAAEQNVTLLCADDFSSDTKIRDLFGVYLDGTPSDTILQYYAMLCSTKRFQWLAKEVASFDTKLGDVNKLTNAITAHEYISNGKRFFTIGYRNRDQRFINNR